MKLALGTVQFGLDYGISNKKGKVGKDIVQDIFNLAKKNNITTLDTATSYGDSEKVIGDITKAKNLKFNIITKFTPSDIQNNKIEISLENLKAESVFGILLHNSEELLTRKKTDLYNSLLEFKKNGLCKKIGCSVYSPNEALDISKNYNIDIFQIPSNLFDQRLFTNDILQKIKSTGAEVHIRSVFLQGVVFIPFNRIPLHLNKLRPQLEKLQKDNNKLTIAKALAPFVQNKLIDKIVIGCCSVIELKQIISAYNIAKTLKIKLEDFEITDIDTIDPRNWPN
jgi:aryl-alcohol dehydrogenase-like predicted oxidoreductase